MINLQFQIINFISLFLHYFFIIFYGNIIIDPRQFCFLHYWIFQTRHLIDLNMFILVKTFKNHSVIKCYPIFFLIIIYRTIRWHNFLSKVFLFDSNAFTINPTIVFKFLFILPLFYLRFHLFFFFSSSFNVIISFFNVIIFTFNFFYFFIF